MKFVIATRDYAGLGFSIRLQDEGHEVLVATNPPNEDRDNPAYHLVGQDIVKKASLDEVIAEREAMRDWYWIWDFNHAVEQNERLRSEGFKVVGGGGHANTMEHDRAACLDFAATYGLEAPASHAFSSAADAIRFCEANPHTVYVYKPDEGANFETFLPESEDPGDANLELRMHLESLHSETSFILQERKDGVETNVEVWMQEGEPVFAFMTLECKRKCAMDLGELVGCAFDFVFTIPLDCKAVTESVGKLYPAYKKMRYTGFADANFIASRDGIWFFEKCERFGYNTHPNLLFNLSRRSLAEVLSSLAEGNLKPDFSGGFGASVTMSTKANPVGGKVIHFPPKLWKDIYWWDVYKKGDHYLTAGYDKAGDVLIVTAYGYTIQTAWEKLMTRASQIKFPYRSYRPDGDRTDYPTSPIRRYEALRAMGYI
jgi:phosphoribosylamine-glycine ligase